jgi:hypothetical protein
MSEVSLALWAVLATVISPALLADDAGAPCQRSASNTELARNPAEQFVTPNLKRFYSLDENIKAAYAARNDPEVVALATEYLNLAMTYRCNWNYGNAVHDGNRYLGLVSLHAGRVENAARFLELAGKTPGSPQLDSFGPDLDLADELLKRGQTIAVEHYLTDVKAFWRLDHGQVDRWLAAIAAGERPTLDKFSAVTNGPWMTAGRLFDLAWPEFIVLSSLFAARKRLNSKPSYVIVASVIAYGAYYLFNWAFRSVMDPLILTQLARHGPTAAWWALNLSSVLVVIAAPVLAVFGCLRIWYRRMR